MDDNVTHERSADARESQFSLRGLFLFLSACCIFLGLLSIADTFGVRWMLWTGMAFLLLASLFLALVWQQPDAIWIALGVVSAAFFLPLNARQDGTHRDSCRRQLRHIAIALQNYHDVHGQLPPAYLPDSQGRPMHSWRVLLLPFLEMQALYDQYDFDEPWNGPNNSKLANHPDLARIFHCRGDKRPGAASYDTSYVAVVGNQTAWPGSESLDFRSVSDGVESTLSIVEVKNSGIHWMEPRDLDFQILTLRINPPGTTVGLSSHHHDGCYATCCDGHVVYLPNDTPPATLRAFLTRDGGEDKKLLAKWRRY